VGESDLSNNLAIKRSKGLQANDAVSENRLSKMELQQRHQRYLQAATSENTRNTYRSAIRHFERWGGYLPTDKETILRYLLEHADKLNPRTLSVRLTALSQWHQYQGFLDPCQHAEIRTTLKGIRRTHGKPKQKAKALRLEHLAAMLKYLYGQVESCKSMRDIALIQIAFFGAFRRSELVNIEIKHLSWEQEGLLVMLPQSKTDQEGEGVERAIPMGMEGACPVTALRAWLDFSKIESGPIFRPISRWGIVKEKALSPGAVNEIIKTLGTACAFDFIPELSSHSFRRGLSTSAARAEVDFELIRKQGGWRSDSTVRGYIEEGRQFKANAASPLLTDLEKLLNSKSN